MHTFPRLSHEVQQHYIPAVTQAGQVDSLSDLGASCESIIAIVRQATQSDASAAKHVLPFRHALQRSQAGSRSGTIISEHSHQTGSRQHGKRTHAGRRHRHQQESRLLTGLHGRSRSTVLARSAIACRRQCDFAFCLTTSQKCPDSSAMHTV